MTKTVKAGRELDAIVADKVIGCTLDWEMTPECDHIAMDGRCEKCLVITADHPYDIPAYSTDIAAAWQVVEKMVRGGWGVSVCYYHSNGGWHAEFFNPGRMRNKQDISSAPIAICLAALESVGVDTASLRSGKESK